MRSPEYHRMRAADPRHPPIDHLVVATAGDDASLGAIHVGVELGRRENAAVTAIAVAAPFPLGAVSPSLTATNEDNRLELLTILRETLATVPGTEHWETRAVIGTPAVAVTDAAGEDPETLILMGLGHHGQLDRFFGGETTVPMIQHARVPVFLVASNARALPRRAVAALDFKEASMTAAAVAADLLDDDGTLTLAHVDAFGNANAKPGDLIDLYREGIHARLDAAVRRLWRRTARRIESVVLAGQTADELLRYADEAKCDLIALGGHELGLVDRILLGSVRTKIVRAAKCSVLIAPQERQGTPEAVA